MLDLRQLINTEDPAIARIREWMRAAVNPCELLPPSEQREEVLLQTQVTMHELGHHFDRMTQKHRDSTRGEDYAERFAASRFQTLLREYIRAFGDPRRSC